MREENKIGKTEANVLDFDASKKIEKSIFRENLEDVRKSIGNLEVFIFSDREIKEIKKMISFFDNIIEKVKEKEISVVSSQSEK